MHYWRQVANSRWRSRRLGTLAIEIFNTINNINPIFMKDISKPKSDAKIRPFDVSVNALEPPSWQ